MTRLTRLLRLALTLSVCLCAGANAATQRVKSSPPRRAIAPSAPLPVVAELDLEGLKRLLARGDDASKAKPLLVNFWATWCDPCREEFPDLVRVNDDYKARGLEFAAVSADEVSEIKAGVPQFLKLMNAKMSAYLLNVPDMGEAINLIDPAWGGELPATYLYDRSGQLVFKHSGRVDPKELRAALDKVLAAN